MVVTTSNFEEMSGPSTVERVRAVDDDGCRLYLEFRNGLTATVNSSNPLECEVGSIVLVRAEQNHIELAPDELWPEDSWVGWFV